MNEEAVRRLTNAKALIDHPNKWTRGQCLSLGGRMCAIGALNKTVSGDAREFPAYHDDTAGPGYDELITVACQLYPYSRYGGWPAGDTVHVTEYNDEHKHAQVMEMFDLAIDKARNG